MTVANSNGLLLPGETKREFSTSMLSALHQVRELIVEGKLSPGTCIVERELARQLHLSRTPARAALQRLQQEGYIRVHHTGNKAQMIVSPLTKEDADELYTLIGRLEGLAGRITASLLKSERLVIAQKMKILNQRLARIRNNPSKQKEFLILTTISIT